MEPTTNDTTLPMPAPARAKVRAWQWILLGVGVLVFAATLGFLRNSSTDRDAAIKSRRLATRVLAAERSSVHDAESEVASVQHQASRLVPPAEFALSKMQELLTIADQQVAESQTTQRLGADAATSVDDYNASVDRNNAIVDQYNAKLTELLQYVDQLRNTVNA